MRKEARDEVKGLLRKGYLPERVCSCWPFLTPQLIPDGRQTTAVAGKV